MMRLHHMIACYDAEMNPNNKENKVCRFVFDYCMLILLSWHSDIQCSIGNVLLVCNEFNGSHHKCYCADLKMGIIKVIIKDNMLHLLRTLIII